MFPCVEALLYDTHTLSVCFYFSNAQGQLTPHEQKELVAAANFSERDIKKIYKRFSALDTNQNGELDAHELFEVPEICEVRVATFKLCGIK